MDGLDNKASFCPVMCPAEVLHSADTDQGEPLIVSVFIYVAQSNFFYRTFVNKSQLTMDVNQKKEED